VDSREKLNNEMNASQLDDARAGAKAFAPRNENGNSANNPN
jgi:hypothetical protein